MTYWFINNNNERIELETPEEALAMRISLALVKTLVSDKGIDNTGERAKRQNTLAYSQHHKHIEYAKEILA